MNDRLRLPRTVIETQRAALAATCVQFEQKARAFVGRASYRNDVQQNLAQRGWMERDGIQAAGEWRAAY